MDNLGFFRVASAVPVVKVADIEYNKEQICNLIDRAEAQRTSLIVFPELCVTGYTCGDLFGQNQIIEAAEDAVKDIKYHTRGKQITAVIGAPVKYNDKLYNCAIVLKNGTIRGIVPKIFLPTYNEFYESRWFASGSDFIYSHNRCGHNLREDGKNFFDSDFEGVINYAGFKTNINPNIIFNVGGVKFAVEICEDLWTPIPPSSYHCLAGAQVIVNLSASNEILLKEQYRKDLISDHSARTISAYVYSSAGFGESTQDLVYSGAALIYENGALLNSNKRFELDNSLIISDLDIERLSVLRQKMNTFYSVSPDGNKNTDYKSNYLYADLGKAAETDFQKELHRFVEPHPFIPKSKNNELNEREKEVISLQVMGLVTRLNHIGCQSVVLGISGGLDSTLALLVSVLAFDKLGWDRKRIIGVTMPGFGTTDRTYTNALGLMDALGITRKEISIVDAVKQHFKDIEHDIDNHDVTYENSQARERTQILMDLANKEKGIVIGTGDLSELALGWATYNGDQMSMYCVNGGVPKTLVKHLIKWAANNTFENSDKEIKSILLDIVDTPVSPELTPSSKDGKILQVTEDIVGPYELHDFYLYNYFKFGYGPKKIYFLALKAFDGQDGRPKYDEEVIKKYLRTFYWRFFSQQFKRSCMPDCPKVGSVSLSPRGDWRMPSDAKVKLFMDEIEKL